MNSFSFFLSGKVFICSSILNDSFAGCNLGYRSLLFMTLNISCQSLLACKVPLEKSTGSLVGTPLLVTNLFSIAAFKILFLSLTFGSLTMIRGSLNMMERQFNSWSRPLCILLVWDSLCFLELHVYFLYEIKFSFIIFSNRFPTSCSFFFPSGTPMMQMLECFKMRIV